MQHRRLLEVILLNIITLGFYHIYWLYKTRKELLESGAPSIPPVVTMFVPVFGTLPAVIGIAVMGGMGMLDDGAGDQGWAIAGILSVVIILLLLVATVISFIWHYKYAVAVEVVTQGKAERGMTYFMFIISNFMGLPLIWPVIMQEDFNKLALAAAIKPAAHSYLSSK